MSEIRNRLEKNVKKLGPWAERLKIEAYRIYERDIPEYPFIVDCYKDRFVVYDRSDDVIDAKAEKKEHFPELLAAIRELFGASEEQIIVKRRERQKGESQYEKIAETERTTIVTEGDARFIVNLYDYLDTGLFLDHRLMRERIRSMSKGKDVLNLFCYTGSVSVFAALGGGRVTSVDMSSTYIGWAKDNFLENQIPLAPHDFVIRNALDYLADTSNPKRFDVIFLDPPTFSNSKKMESSFEVERDQMQIVEGSMRLLKPDGVLFFSNNKRTFKLALELSSRYDVRDISEKTIPKDFRDPKIHKVFEIRHRRS